MPPEGRKLSENRVNRKLQKRHPRQKRRIVRWIKASAYVSSAAACFYFLAVGVRYWVNNSDIFRVSYVEVTGSSLLSEDDVRAMVTPVPEQRIFDIDLESIRRKIEANPFVFHVSIGRKLPKTIRVDLQERVPVAYLSLGEVYLVDSEGYLLPKPDGGRYVADFPIITGISMDNPVPGARCTDENLQDALSFLRRFYALLPDFREAVSEIHKQRNGATILFLSDNGTRIDFGHENYRIKLLKLRYFLEYRTLNNKDDILRYINLNFRDQVVVKEAS